MARGRLVSTASSDHMLSDNPDREGFLDELVVLKPTAPDDDSDEYPCYILKDAIVYDTEGRQMANLLHAELEGPFIIRGTLEIPKEHRALKLIAGNRHNVSLRDITEFSMGDSENVATGQLPGPPIVWAKGRAGWFEIHPAGPYQAIYDDMMEGIKIYFFFVDLYTEAEEKRSAGKAMRIDMRLIIKRYAEHFGPSNLNEEDLSNELAKHASFLISHMRKDGTFVSWKKKAILEWLRSRFPDIHNKYMSKDGESKVSEFTTNDSESTKATAENLSQEELVTKSKLATPLSSSVVSTIYKEVDRLYKSNRHLRLQDVVKDLVEQYEIESESVAKELIRSNAPALLRLMSSSWHTSPIYGQLEKITAQPYSPTHNSQVVPPVSGLTRRQRIATQKPRSPSVLSTTEERGRISHPTRTVIQTSTSGSTSSLPEGNGLSNEAIVPMAEDVPSASTQSLSVRARRSSRSGKGAGKNAILRTPSQPTKFARDATPSASDEELSDLDPSDMEESSINTTIDATNNLSPPGKRLKASLGEDSMSEDELAGSHRSYRDVDYAEEYPTTQVELEVITEALPPSLPTGPRGTWRCNQEGCNYEVPAANKPKGREAIRAHFLEHADEHAFRENLVIMEGKRECLPINNLLDKIRRMGEQKRKAEEEARKSIGGRIVPLPIKRKLDF